jgi:hypothetical protein
MFGVHDECAIKSVYTATSSVANGTADEAKKPDHCKATRMFRKAFVDMELNIPNDSTQDICNLKDDTSANHDNNSFYAAYIQAHWLMKSTNLRLDDNNESQQMFCTQTWPRSLCNRNDIDRFNSDYSSHTVTCLNPAEIWCDYPSCKEARCGKQGCLKCYRFLPREYTFSANGMVVGRQSERSYDMVSFVKCSWCCVSFCNMHLDSYFSISQGVSNEQLWHQCDVCQKSSCRECVSQVFDSPPDANGCQVVTNRRVCGRKVCSDCMWRVGLLHNESGSFKVVSRPGGKVSSEEKELLSNTEQCCHMCRPLLETRMKEMQAMQNSFMGFMP